MAYRTEGSTVIGIPDPPPVPLVDRAYRHAMWCHGSCDCDGQSRTAPVKDGDR